LGPILDLLVAKVPPEWQLEIRLGLQEALVNAAKHGNQLDPSKTVIVQYAIMTTEYTWVITDKGAGFIPCGCQDNPEHLLPNQESEGGRGLCILYHIFDQVHWNEEGTQLKLIKKRR
jgi:serine/threonine-protein kinase RsbW